MESLPEPPCKKVKQEQEEPEESGVTMNDLPELPFEKILGYLSLQDRIRSMVVSRRWYSMINSFRVKSLCYSDRPSGFIYNRSRLIEGAFASNFISSPRFEPFLNTFSKSILSSLKHLRLFGFNAQVGNQTAFTRTINSFGQLEELGFFDLNCLPNMRLRNLKLKLPMLNSIQFENVRGIKQLTLDAPRLQKVRHWHSYDLSLDFAQGEDHPLGESQVERLLTDSLINIAVTKLKNLKFLHSIGILRVNFLSGLKQLEEIHLSGYNHVSKIFEQKQRHGLNKLKIFLCGLLLNGPEDPAIDFLRYYNEPNIDYLIQNRSRLADEISLCYALNYYAISQHVPQESEFDFLSRFIDLKEIRINRPVQNIERFLNLLKTFDGIVKLEFNGDQPHDLFNRLPEHCAVQSLALVNLPPDLGFLFRLSNLIYLQVFWSIDTETIRNCFEQLKFLSSFTFRYFNKTVTMHAERSRQFSVRFDLKWKPVADLNAAIQLIEKTRPEK